MLQVAIEGGGAFTVLAAAAAAATAAGAAWDGQHLRNAQGFTERMTLMRTTLMGKDDTYREG